jgi:hypothetical protein
VNALRHDCGPGRRHPPHEPDQRRANDRGRSKINYLHRPVGGRYVTIERTGFLKSRL